MKKQLLTLSCVLLCLTSYAQSAFTEATFTAMMNRLQTDPAFFKNEADPSFTLTFGNGGTATQESMLKSVENLMGLYKREDTNLKVSQVGSTGIATGIVVESFTTKENPTIVRRTSKNLFTYTFSQVNGKWWWVAAQHTAFPEVKFTAATMKEILDEYKKDSKAFFNNRLSEDFRFTNQKGNYQPQKDFLGGTAQSIVSAEMLQPVIFQSGDLAVTSGIHHNILTNKEGNQYTRDVAATYTWQRRNGKWMFVGSQQNNITAPAAEDEAAIKNVIEGESTAFYQRNADQVLTYWAKMPYASHSYNEKGSGYVRGYEMVSDVVKKYISAHPELSKGSFKNRDYIIHVNGASAWATFIQDQSAGDKKSISYASRYLEKDNSGAWKIVGNSSSTAK